MLAILLATGETGKLGPLASVFPSPMAPIVNRPVMSYVIELLARHGIKHILVSLCNRASDIEAYFGEGRRWGVRLEYILQRDGWGTAGALKWAGRALGETFLCMPADSVVDVDLTAVIDWHSSIASRATPVVHGQEEHDTGIYVFDPQVLQFIPARTCFDIHDHLLPSLVANGWVINRYRASGYWNRLESLHDFQDAQQVILRNVWNKPASSGGIPSVRYPFLEGRQIAKGIWVGRNNVIHPSARLTPPLYIGDNCWIGPAVELGPEAILGSHIVVDSEATIIRSIILDHTYVGQLVNIVKCLVNKGSVIDLATGDRAVVVDKHLLGHTDQEGARNHIKRFINLVGALLVLLVLMPLLVLLSLLLLVFEGRVFDRVRRFKPDMPDPTSSATPGIRSFNLLQFHIPGPGSFHQWLRALLVRFEWFRLPEFWNVIVGDMALVGVKPSMPEEIVEAAGVWPEKLSDYSPGFTGLWYVQADPDVRPGELPVVDRFYLATHNWKEDLRLLLRTPFEWMRRVRQYGG